MEDVKLVGAIDEGTSSARFILFRAGTDEIVCFHQIDVPTKYPQETWVEQDPLVIYDIVKSCINECVKQLQEIGGDVQNIVAVGITNQRESVVVWDRRTGLPLHDAIIWSDNRTTTTVDKLLNTTPDRNINYLKEICGLPLSTYFSALKLRWLYDNDEKVRASIENNTAMFGTIDSWIIYNLTGGCENGGIHITDVTNASRTMLMNIETLKWDPFLLKFFNLPSSILPKIVSSAEYYGDIKDTDIKGVPITAILGDQQAALVGHQCFYKGQAKTTYGTGGFLLYNTGPKFVTSSHGLLTTVAYQFGQDAAPVYALEGSIAVAGSALKWLRDNLGLFESIGQVEAMASMVPNSLDVFFVPAFSGLYAPYWNQEARGVICGLSEQTTSEHIVRATLESICFQVRDILDAMKQDCGIPLGRLFVDGGMTVNKLFLQLQSDLIGIDVVPSKITETTALGVAISAYQVVEPKFDIGSNLSIDNTISLYKPGISSKERNTLYAKWKMAVERAIDWNKPDVP